MEEEYIVPKTLRPKLRELETLSVKALNEYIVGLEGEIERICAAISAKESWRSEAKQFFKS